MNNETQIGGFQMTTNELLTLSLLFFVLLGAIISLIIMIKKRLEK